MYYLKINYSQKLIIMDLKKYLIPVVLTVVALALYFSVIEPMLNKSEGYEAEDYDA
jgi:hypothetical protein